MGRLDVFDEFLGSEVCIITDSVLSIFRVLDYTC